MKNIKNFKKIHYYSGNGKITDKEAYDLGICTDPINGDYETLEEMAYQTAYDISHDWIKEEPEWKDVEEGYKRGVEDGIKYVISIIENKIKKYSNDADEYDVIAQRKYSLELILEEINKNIN